jgi:hypothetical protein
MKIKPDETRTVYGKKGILTNRQTIKYNEIKNILKLKYKYMRLLAKIKFFYFHLENTLNHVTTIHKKFCIDQASIAIRYSKNI